MKIKQEIINIREYNELLIKRGLEMMKKNATKDTTIAERRHKPLQATPTPKLIPKYQPTKKTKKQPLKR